MERKGEVFDLSLFVALIHRQPQIQEKMSKCQKVWLISLNLSPYWQKFQSICGIESEVFVHCLQICDNSQLPPAQFPIAESDQSFWSVDWCLEVGLLRLVQIDACLSVWFDSPTVSLIGNLDQRFLTNNEISISALYII